MKMLLGLLLVALSIVSAMTLMGNDPLHNFAMLINCAVLAAVGSWLLGEEQ